MDGNSPSEDTGTRIVADEISAVGWRWTMDAQGTMRLMFDTMDAYDRADFDRLAEIYAEDASWINADPEGPHGRNRDDIFAMFRARMGSDARITFDELRSTPTQVVLTARAADFGRVVSVFSFEGRRIVAIRDYPSMEAAESAVVQG
jgi:limonene-1,2-epoxide hydrolase